MSSFFIFFLGEDYTQACQFVGVNPEHLIAADLAGDNWCEILADFGALGLWLKNEGAWSQISANNRASRNS
jgi:hypothetical protein